MLLARFVLQLELSCKSGECLVTTAYEDCVFYLILLETQQTVIKSDTKRGTPKSQNSKSQDHVNVGHYFFLLTHIICAHGNDNNNGTRRKHATS